ncbi:MAG: ATP-binding protein [Kofleriaceae bacterium]
MNTPTAIIPGSADPETLIVFQARCVERMKLILLIAGAARTGVELPAAVGERLRAINAELEQLESVHALPFSGACVALGFDPFQKAAALLIAAPHLDDSIREAIASFWGQPNRRHVDAALIIELFCSDSIQRVARASSLFEGSALHGAGFVESSVVAMGHSASRLEAELVPTARLLRLFDGTLGVDPRFRGIATLISSDVEAAIGVCEPHTLRETAMLLAGAEAATPRGGVALFAGSAGYGKLRLARTMAVVAHQIQRLLVVEASQLPADPARLGKLIEALGHEAELLAARLVIRRVDQFAVEPRSAAYLRHAVKSASFRIWMTSDIDPARVDAPLLADLATLNVSVGISDIGLRKQAWHAELARLNQSLDDDSLRAIASDFPLPRSAIETTAKMASALALVGGGVKNVLPRVAESQMLGQLGRFAKLSKSKARIADVVLTDNTREQIMELLAALKARRNVHERWGLAERHAIGRGIVAMFNGPPGTGKTMTAAAIANEIEMPLYRIDASSIMDRYVGETEKNLVRLFDEAAASRAALLFDEADALFGKRVEAEDSGDRYANLQVNTLLNLIEDYDGFVVLTTNIKGALDQAFLRRIIYKIGYEKPEADQLVQLWEYHLPDSIDCADDVDTEALAEEFDQLAGGDVKNAVLRAALAAGDGQVTHAMLRRAVINELRANGGVVVG